MRVQAALLVSLVSLVGCGGEEAKPPETPKAPVAATPPPPPAPAETAKPAPPPKPSLAEMQKIGLMTALEGLNGHDPKKFASVYADNAVVSVAGLNEVQGRDAIAANMAEWFETFKDVKLGFSRVWVKGDQMVLEWVINGKHHGELFGVKGTEQPIGHYGLSIVSFDQDGKVAREHRYGELGAVMSQIGGKGAKAAPARPIPPVPEKPETIAAKGTPEEEKNLEAVKTLFGALESRKEADFLAAVSDDIEHDGLLHLDTGKGKGEAKKFFQGFTKAFPDAKFEMTKAHAIGEYAIVESTMKGTQKGPLGAIAATKKPVAIHLVDVVRVKDGKVARVWTYQNSVELQQQLGLFDIAASGNIPASQATAPKTDKPADKPAAPADKKK